MKKTTNIKACGVVFLLLYALSIFGQIDRPEFVPDQLIVKFKQDKSTRQRASLRHEMDGSLRKTNPHSKAEVWDIDPSQDISKLIKEYENHPYVEFLEPNFYYYLAIDEYKKTDPDEECENTLEDKAEENPSIWKNLKSLIDKIAPKNKELNKIDAIVKKQSTVVSTIPNDSQLADQWGMHNTGQAGGTSDADIDAPEAWDIASVSPSVVIGLIDTGVDWTHPDLVNNIWQNLGEDADGDGQVLEWDGSAWVFDPGDSNRVDDDGNGYIDDLIGWDFNDNDNDPTDNIGHGTHVAGTIGAEGNNEIGVAGVTWDVQIAALRVFSQQNTPTDVIVEAIDYAVMMDMPLSNNSYAEGQFSNLMLETLENAQNNEHLFIAAAGNFRNDNDAFPNYPSSYNFDNIISVVATDRNDQLWVQSNNRGSSFGATNADIGAPGDSLFSTGPQNDYYYNTGTSMATPHVTGACALLIEQNPARTYDEIKSALLNTVDVPPDLVGRSVSGGRLNLHGALNYFDDSEPMNCRERDSLALVALYNATDGANWDTYAIWDLTSPIEEWFGVTLNENGCVSNINLSSDGLSGIIPPEIGNLSDISELDLSRNYTLTGSIPPEIGNLNNLWILRLESNQLIGNIPSTIGNLENLGSLRLNGNELNGNIPSTIGNLEKLQSLHLHNNQLTGIIPTTLWSLTRLATLLLAGNQLSGSIPSEIENLTILGNLNLSNNTFSGSIPSEIANLNNLTRIVLSHNQLSGCYDVNLLNLDNEIATNSDISTGNNFDVPWETFLYSFDGTGACTSPIYNNCTENDSLALVKVFNSINGFPWDLNQPIMTWEGVTLNGFGCVTKLEYIFNNLEGIIPVEIGNLNNLKLLSLHHNQLYGNIPSSIGNLTNLRSLGLAHNQLNGSIPSEIGNLTNLYELYLNNNHQLNGNIPSSIGNLTNLRHLYLTYNQLNGSIPSEIGNLTNLYRLDLDHNQLSGSIPAEIGSLAVLTYLNLSINQLSGCYDENLAQLCSQLYYNNNTHISSGNNFDARWEDFCNNDAGACATVEFPSLVWPGDYNHSGTADETDALYWGIAVGNAGDIRLNATTNWQGQEAPDWTADVEGVNGKHQDGNGDGIIDGADLQVLENNFGSIHDFNNPVYIAGQMIYELVQGIPVSGRSSYDIYVSYRGGGFADVHGLSGVIEFGDWQINDVTLSDNNSSLNPSDIFRVFDQVENRLHFALTRTDKVNKVCNGPVAKIIIDADYYPSVNSVRLDVKKGSAIHANGNTVKVTGTSFYPQEPSGLANNNLVVGASVMHEQCTMLGSITLSVEGGTLPYTYQWNTGAISNSLSDLTANIYNVTVTDASEETKTLSVEVQGQYISLPDEFGNYPDCINPLCPTLITPNGNIIAGAYKASTAVNSMGTINGAVQFKAGEMILLREGFEVKQDKVFSAEIEDCGN